MIAAWRGIARTAAARWTRGPLLPAAMIVMWLAMVGAPTTLVGDNVVAAWRDDASYAIGMVAWVVLIAAVVLSCAGGAPAARAAEGRVAGGRIAVLGHATALWLVVAVLGAAGAGEASAWLRWRHPSAETAAGAVVHAPLWTNRAPLRATASTPASMDVELPPSGLRGGRVRWFGAFRLTAGDTGPAGIPTARLALSIDGKPAVDRLVRPDGTGRVSEIFDVPPSARRLGFTLRGGASTVAFDAVPGALRVVGDPVPTFGALLRAGLSFAMVGLSIAMFVLLLGNFMHPAIAVAAGVTVALVASVVGASETATSGVLGVLAPWLPGWMDVDAARALRLGVSTTWTPVVDGALRALAWTAAAVLLAPATPKVEESRA